MERPIRILIVDDNETYRQAFAGNLQMQGWEVAQAGDADGALECLRDSMPDVMITDLQMRRPDEGLELIRTAREIAPCLPAIMISAVGTFDEGAEAMRLGAARVLSKSRIEEQMSLLHESVRECASRHQAARAALDEIASAREGQPAEDAPQIDRLRAFAADDAMPAYVREEAADALASLSQARMHQHARTEAAKIADAAGGDDAGRRMEEVDEALASEIARYQELDDDTRDALRTAEYLFRSGKTLGARIDVSRTACFSYSFSVENQSKAVYRKRVNKFVGEKQNLRLVQSMLEEKTRQVNMFLQQHLLQTIRKRKMDFSIENVRQTFLRIMEHRAKYRPDGLKALGIMILVFGRTYTVQDFTANIRVDNPLGVRGLDSDEEVVTLAQLLIKLQHLRNPYIHPEIQGCEPVEVIRDTAVNCLNLLMRSA